MSPGSFENAAAAVVRARSSKALDSDAIRLAVVELAPDPRLLSLGGDLLELGYASIAGWIAQTHLDHTPRDAESHALMATCALALLRSGTSEPVFLHNVDRAIRAIVSADLVDPRGHAFSRAFLELATAQVHADAYGDVPRTFLVASFEFAIPPALTHDRIVSVARATDATVAMQDRRGDWSDTAPLVLLELRTTGLILTLRRRTPTSVAGTAEFSAMMGSRPADAEQLAAELLHAFVRDAGASALRVNLLVSGAILA